MTIDRQSEHVHLFEQMIEHFGKDIIIKGAFSLILNTSQMYPAINGRLTMDIDFYLKRKFSDFLEDLKVSGISDIAGNPYVFEKQRTPKKNSGGRVAANAEGKVILLDVQIDEYTNPTMLMEGRFRVEVTNPISIAMDKLDAISKPKVVNRPKDLFDLYVISLLYEFLYTEIQNHSDFKISGDFQDFIEEWESIRDSYHTTDILISNDLPDFDKLYIRVKEFASPFIVSEELTTRNLKWSTEKGVWVSNDKSSGLMPFNVFADKRNEKLRNDLWGVL